MEAKVDDSFLNNNKQQNNEFQYQELTSSPRWKKLGQNLANLFSDYAPLIINAEKEVKSQYNKDLINFIFNHEKAMYYNDEVFEAKNELLEARRNIKYAAFNTAVPGFFVGGLGAQLGITGIGALSVIGFAAAAGIVTASAVLNQTWGKDATEALEKYKLNIKKSIDRRIEYFQSEGLLEQFTENNLDNQGETIQNKLDGVKKNQHSKDDKKPTVRKQKNTFK